MFVTFDIEKVAQKRAAEARAQGKNKDEEAEVLEEAREVRAVFEEGGHLREEAILGRRRRRRRYRLPSRRFDEHASLPSMARLPPNRPTSLPNLAHSLRSMARLPSEYGTHPT
eukprot:659039-Prymnesium_polylepis.1